MPKINTNDLQPDTVFMVRGKVAFSRITRFMTKAEFDTDNQRRASNGRPSRNKPVAHISLQNAQIVCQNPNALSINEQYGQQKLFLRPNAPETGYNFTGEQSGMFEVLPDGSTVTTGILPTLWEVTADGSFRQIQPQGELANGLDVIAVMRVYKTAMNNGVALDRVLCNEPVRYYSGQSAKINTAMAGYGLSFTPDPSIDTRVTAASYGQHPEAGAAPVQPVPQTQPVPYAPAAPAPAPAPAPTPTAPVYPAAPAPQPAQPDYFSSAPAPAAPVPPAAPAQPFGVPPTAFPSAPGVTPAPAAPVNGVGYQPGADPERQY